MGWVMAAVTYTAAAVAAVVGLKTLVGAAITWLDRVDPGADLTETKE